MTKRFSPEEARTSLASDVGYEFDLSSSFMDAKLVGGLASSARSFMNSAIKCFLVGYNDPGHRLLEKAELWLEAAIDSNERPQRYFKNGTEAVRLYDLALCRWLAHNAHDVDLLTQSIDFRERYFDTSVEIDLIEFILVLPEYVDANRFSDAAKRIRGLRKLGKRPLELKAATVIAEGAGESAIGQKLINDLYNAKVAEWLGRGHFDLAAKWIKIGRWLPNKSVSAVDIIVKLATSEL